MPTIVSMAFEDKSSEFPIQYTYKIKNDYVIETQTMLLITAYYADGYADFYKNKYHTLSQIISSHWNVNINIINENDYENNLINDYDIIFYIKEDREEIPESLNQNLLTAQNKKIIVSGFVSDLISQIINTDLKNNDINISQIKYKDVLFLNDQELFLTFDTRDIINLDAIESVFATSSELLSDNTYPFAFKFNNPNLLSNNNNETGSSYLALPFLVPSYYKTNSYSTIFLDLLYEGIGNHKAQNNKTALIRLEDVNVHTYYQPRKLRKVYEFLKSKEIPFHIAFIVKYIDPEHEIAMRPDEGRRFFNLLNKIIGEGYGTLIQHGYTHQIENSVSGIGFEFWDAENNTPLSYESREFVIDRIKAAKNETAQLGLPVPDIWETPHYAASELADGIFNDFYPIRYEHIKGIGTLPFVSKFDQTIYIPENLGFLSDDSDDFIFGQDLDSIEQNLVYLEVFRDPTASIFWHPWRKMNEIKQIVNMFEERGYTFVDAYDLIEQEGLSPALTSLNTYQSTYAEPISYKIGNLLIIAIYTFFILGCLLYLRTIIRLKRYNKVFDTFKLTSEEVQKVIISHGKKLPFFTIFVPARNEGLVIGNTIRRLSAIDYPKDSYRVVIIVDEREMDDNVEITTKSVVKKVGKEINKKYDTDLIHYVEVPKWYSGVYGDFSENSQKSTKGRALNYTLQTLQKRRFWNQVDMIGVLDADGRLHPNALKEAAYSRVFSASKVLQGPVLQVSNFSNVSIVGIAAGIELAIHHLTELPNNLLNSKRVQFLAGTNYFIDKNLIADVGGWDQDALVEDAELALRIYIKTGIRADWIGSPEIEQTPENFTIYKKQRRRWVRGHLDLIKTIREAPIPLTDKILFFWKIFVSQFRFILDLGFPIIALVFLFLGMFIDLGSGIAFLSVLLLIFAIFMWDMYGYIYRKISNYINPEMSRFNKLKMSFKLFFFSPVFMFVQSVPRILALVDYIRSAPMQWYKTERTAEKPTL